MTGAEETASREIMGQWPFMESSLKKSSLMHAEFKRLPHKNEFFLREKKAFHNFITNFSHDVGS